MADTPPDEQCKTPKDVLTHLECMGLSWAGVIHSLAHKKSLWESLKPNNRLVYISIDVALIVLALVVLGVLFGRHGNPKK